VAVPAQDGSLDDGLADLAGREPCGEERPHVDREQRVVARRPGEGARSVPDDRGFDLAARPDRDERDVVGARHDERLSLLAREAPPLERRPVETEDAGDVARVGDRDPEDCRVTRGLGNDLEAQRAHGLVGRDRVEAHAISSWSGNSTTDPNPPWGRARARPQSCRCPSCSACASGSTWNVEWATSKWSARHSESASRTRPCPPPAKASSETTTCADITGTPEVSCHTCRSCTSRTPSIPMTCPRTSSRSTSSGTPSSSTCPT